MKRYDEKHRESYKIYVYQGEDGLGWHWWITAVSDGFVMKRVARVTDDKISIAVYTYPHMTVSLKDAVQFAQQAKQHLKEHGHAYP